ncbi:MAG: hypothetical protein GY851_10560 [bacterium]|nr:hypothetical protein [bacterium]
MSTRRHDTCRYFDFDQKTALNSTGTALKVGIGEIAGAQACGLAPPFWLAQDLSNGEEVECTAWSSTGDATSTGDTLTVVRGANGTSARSISTGTDQWLVSNVSAQHEEINTHFDRFGEHVATLRGAGDGVARYGNEFEVIPTTGGASMAVTVKSGEGQVDRRPVWSASNQNTSTITAPTATGKSRIDVVQLSEYSVASVLAGTADTGPSAPAVSTGYMKLAEILLTTGTASITATGITDTRIFL